MFSLFVYSPFAIFYHSSIIFFLVRILNSGSCSTVITTKQFRDIGSTSFEQPHNHFYSSNWLHTLWWSFEVARTSMVWIWLGATHRFIQFFAINSLFFPRFVQRQYVLKTTISRIFWVLAPIKKQCPERLLYATPQDCHCHTKLTA